MNDVLLLVLPALITAVVTIIGFIVTYFLNMKNFKEEVNKQKMNINLDKMVDLPYKIQELLDIIIIEQKNSKIILPKFKELMTTIFAYGSKDAIVLLANMQELTYSLTNKNSSAEQKNVIVYYILLLCQVKYDLTGTEINPEFGTECV